MFVHSEDLLAAGVEAVAKAIAESRISALQLVGDCLNLMERKNPAINAFVSVNSDSALFAARKIDALLSRGESPGLLAGVPIAIKDNIAVRGQSYTAGIRAYADRVADVDAPVVTALRKAGAIIIGKTTMHEGALGATNDNPFSGRTENPLRPGYTPGGSSGGSAAAIASTMVPGALGTDTLGSVRVPAAYCGLVGFKPSNRLLSNFDIVPLEDSLDTVGPMARTTRDIVRMMHALSRDSVNATTMNWFGHPSACPGHVRVGIISDPQHLNLASDVQSAYLEVVDVLKHPSVTTGDLDLQQIDFGAARRAGFIQAQAGAMAHHREVMQRNPEGFSEDWHRSRQWIESLDKARIERAKADRENVQIFLEKCFARYDVLMLPTTPQTAFSFDDKVPDNQADFTTLANLAGLPAITLPVPGAGGLPVGIQIVGPAMEDDLLLYYANVLESSLKRAI